MTTPRRTLPVGGNYTGTTAVPLPQVIIPENIIDIGIQPQGVFLDQQQVVPSYAVTLRPGGTMPPSFGFNSLPTFGSGTGSTTITGSPLGDLLINRGFDLATSLLTGGGGSPAAAPEAQVAQTYRGVLPGQDPLPPVERADPVPQGVITSTGVSGWPVTKSGKPRRMKKNGQPWKRPSMNPANPRALGRAMRRVNGFATIAKRTISFTKRVRMRKRKRT